MVQSRSGGDVVQIALRLPGHLRDRIRAASDRNGRSMNSEIVATLEDAYPFRVFTAVELARFFHLLPEEGAEEVKSDLQKVNASLNRQGLEMIYQDGEVMIRRLSRPDGQGSGETSEI